MRTKNRLPHWLFSFCNFNRVDDTKDTKDLFHLCGLLLASAVFFFQCSNLLWLKMSLCGMTVLHWSSFFHQINYILWNIYSCSLDTPKKCQCEICSLNRIKKKDFLFVCCHSVCKRCFFIVFQITLTLMYMQPIF